MYEVEIRGRSIKVEFPSDWPEEYIKESLRKLKQAFSEDLCREANRENEATSKEG